jgi:hypothetical protein
VCDATLESSERIISHIEALIGVATNESWVRFPPIATNKLTKEIHMKKKDEKKMPKKDDKKMPMKKGKC